MEIDILTILPIIFPSVLLLWIGSLYLRRKSVVLSMGVFFGFFILIFSIMFIIQIIGAYQRHLDLEREWLEDFGTGYGSPPAFNWYISLFPIITFIPLFIIFAFFFKNAIMIYNIKDEDLSNNLNDALEELKWEYDRDFTYIHVKEPKIKIKVGMMDPARACQIFFRDFENPEVVKQFKGILITKISRNEVNPFLQMGLLFIFMGIFFPLMPIIMLAMI
jgi:hypothetical protein